MNAMSHLPRAARVLAPGLLLALTAACSSTPTHVATMATTRPLLSATPPSPGFLPPIATRTVAPEYPYELRRAGVTDTVMVQCWVDDAGRVKDLRAPSSSHYQLNQSALTAVKRWTFQPAMREGMPVGTEVKVPVIFSLYP